MLFTEDLCFAPPQKCRHVNLSFYESKKKRCPGSQNTKKIPKKKKKIAKNLETLQLLEVSFLIVSKGFNVGISRVLGSREPRRWPPRKPSQSLALGCEKWWVCPATMGFSLLKNDQHLGWRLGKPTV